MNIKRIVVTSVVVLLIAASASAQPRPDKSWRDWFGHFAGGWSIPQGNFGDIVDDGFSLAGGATYWPEDWPVGIVLEMGYSEYDISSSAIDAINEEIDNSGGTGEITGGWASSWSVTANLTWSPSSSGKGFYLIGGIGAYRVEGKISEDGLIYYPPVCNPWYWWCVPGGVGPGTIVVGSASTTEFGWNAGAGWAFPVGSVGSQLYIESRYHSAETSPEATAYLPLAIGYRW